MYREEQVELKGRTFVISKMPAAHALSVLKDLLTKVLPVDLLSMLFQSDEGGVMNDIEKVLGGLKNKKEMSAKEFELFQKDLLKYSSELLKSGRVPVIDELGNFSVSDLEYDLFLLSALLLKILIFNYKDFFTEVLQFLNKMGENLENQHKTEQTQTIS